MLRLFTLATLAAGAAHKRVSDEQQDCSDRNIKLWLHLDITSSFRGFLMKSPTIFKQVLTNLKELYPNLTYGASAFADRPIHPSQQMNSQCYIDGPSFDVADGPAKFDMLTKLTLERRQAYTALPEEDPLEGVPYIAAQKFGEYTEADDELRLLVILTDAGPHYGPKWQGNNQSGDLDIVDPTKTVTCDSRYKWLTIDQIFDPLREARVYPVITLYPQTGAYNGWSTVMEQANFDGAHLEQLRGDYNPQDFGNYLIQTIKTYQCKAPPAAKPTVKISSTTTTTERPTVHVSTTTTTTKRPTVRVETTTTTTKRPTVHVETTTTERPKVHVSTTTTERPKVHVSTTTTTPTTKRPTAHLKEKTTATTEEVIVTTQLIDLDTLPMDEIAELEPLATTEETEETEDCDKCADECDDCHECSKCHHHRRHRHHHHHHHKRHHHHHHCNDCEDNDHCDSC